MALPTVQVLGDRDTGGTLGRAGLGEIQTIGTSAAAIITNPSGAKTYIKGLLLHNPASVSQSVQIYNVPDAAGSVGTADNSSQFVAVDIPAGENLRLPFSGALVLADENDSIQAAAQAITTKASYTGVDTGNSINTDLQAAWLFAEASGNALDLTANNNDGVLTNGATRATVDGATHLSLDGTDDYVAVPDSASLNIAARSITIFARVRFNNATSNAMIAERGPSGASNYYLWHSYDAIASEILVCGFYDGSTFRDFTCPFARAADTWYTLAFVLGSSSAAIYIDGAAQTVSGTLTGTPAGGTAPLYIGRAIDPASGVGRFGGYMDTIRIYERALSDTEIATLHSDPYSGLTTS